ncbi:TatD family hydrolase [Candidatus Micrarchaeota archaeon]|nr:TatD family hydrolase [Candidatus Micrarchaeota archaeon]
MNPQTPIIDAHCHLESYKNIEIKEGWLPITSGYSHHSNLKNAEIGERYKIPYSLGIAPQTIVKEGISKLDMWIDEIKNRNPCAIGEIGLDFHWAKNEQDKINQKLAFNKMLDLAEEMNLPIVIHAREATSEILDILEQRKWSNGIMMHFFSGTLEEAERAVKLGALISITPLHSKERRKVINNLELEHLLVETDSPYVVRTFYDVVQSIDYISEIKGIAKDEVANRTAENAISLFKLQR